MYGGHCTAETLGLSRKLPHSSDMAPMLPFAKPTGYGLGKSGWVSASFTAEEQDLLRAWIDEGYRAIAPKELVAALAGARDDGGAKAGKEVAAASKPSATTGTKSRK